MGQEEYRPWRDARSRPELQVMVAELPAGVRALHAISGDGHRAILVNRTLPPVERLATLAHQLAHDNCKGGCHPGSPRPPPPPRRRRRVQG